MSTSTRQSSLLVAEDWKKIYETFREADFTSYDFETLRKSMIDYLRLYYPEDFNDFVESSEYIALIDLIAFMGQSLAFRTDLNARENFLDTAERRDSILKLARLVNYSPKRSISASGILKIESVSSTESLFDSNGLNLSNLPVSWNDSTNANWQEQFSVILNAALISSQTIGKPGNSQVINGTGTDEYSINTTTGQIAAFPFKASVNGASTGFEVVSATSTNQPYVYEVDPSPNGKFNILYRNDNQGNGSNNTGFFMYFKQGTLKSVDFTLAEGIPNRVLNIGYDSINNTDVWLYDIASTGAVKNLWTSVPAVAGINVIYNKTEQRNLYQVNTRENDQVDLVFGDGSFANVPQGNFRTYFRTNNGLSYKITPDEMQGITISVSYVTRRGTNETLTLRANLMYTVTNSAQRESIDEIRQKAPQQYYTQGRMITGEDYNIVPFTSFSDILKVKAVNRTSSGVSRFLNVSDTSGKYSSTNIFAQDGYLYKEEQVEKINFSFISTANIQQIIQEDLTNILTSNEMSQFYYENFTRFDSDNTEWHRSTLTTNGSTGYFVNNLIPPPGNISQLGYVTSNTTRYIRSGATVKFAAPAGKYFNAQNDITTLPTNQLLPPGGKAYIYAAVMQVIGDGTNGGAGNFTDGTGPVTISQKVPTGALIADFGIIPVFKNNLPNDMITQIVTKIIARNNFALRYDLQAENWQFVVEADINTTSPFSLETGAGDTTGQKKDSSWLIRFEYSNTIGYTIYHRSLSYVFESVLETSFYFDDNVKVYDSVSGHTIHDQIKVLTINPAPAGSSQISLGVDYTWYIYKSIVEADGYKNQNKVLVTFSDVNFDGLPDNPDLFDIIVAPNPLDPLDPTKLVFFQYQVDSTNFTSLSPISSSSVVLTYATKDAIQLEISTRSEGEVFYAYSENRFYVLTSGVLVESVEYVAKVGRENLYFQYRHNSPGYRRIDPTPINIIDVYVLTKAYESLYTAWIQDTTNTIVEPVPPTTEELALNYSALENYKAISDTIIFNSAVFKPLFGSVAAPALQATFKVVKNPALNISDNDIKSSVIGAINTFFDVANWDFGEAFYFSELSAYLHTVLSPNVSSIIIVPTDPSALFGSLYQINAEANEIVTSAATVNNVEIISAITAANINASVSGTSNTLQTGTV